MSKLIMTVGLPRSGKSTWAAGTGLPIVCPDQIRLAIHGKPFAPEHEGLVWWTAKIMVKSLFASGAPTVILDSTAITRAVRDQWKEYRRMFVVFSTPADECKFRATLTMQDYLIPVIERMRGQYEEVSTTEGEVTIL